MPTRMIRDWTDSVRFDGLSAEAERTFVRLIMKADDFGRFHADPRLVKAALFPLLDSLRVNMVAQWLQELAARQLILIYEVQDRQLLAIPRFGQRLKKSRMKFPPMPGKPDEWLPDAIDAPDLLGTAPLPGSSGKFREVPGSSGKFPPEEKKNTNTKKEHEDEDEGGKPPDFSFLPKSLDTPDFRLAWIDFVEHRRQKRVPLTELAVKRQIQQLKLYPVSVAIAAINRAIASGWTGLFPEKEGSKISDKKDDIEFELTPEQRAELDRHDGNEGTNPKRQGDAA